MVGWRSWLSSWLWGADYLEWSLGVTAKKPSVNISIFIGLLLFHDGAVIRAVLCVSVMCRVWSYWWTIIKVWRLRLMLGLRTSLSVSTLARTLSSANITDLKRSLLPYFYFIMPPPNIQIFNDFEVTIENYFSEVGNIPWGWKPRGIGNIPWGWKPRRIFQTEGKEDVWSKKLWFKFVSRVVPTVV